jgi:hypothetical protein
MSQHDPDPDRYKSQGRKERTPAQLAVLTQAREKARIVIAERAKLNALAKKEDSEPEPEDVPPPPPKPVPPKEDSAPENEDEDPRLTRCEVGERPSPKYHYINGMYIKIK